MIPKLLFRFILSVFLSISCLLSAQASLQRDLTSEGAVISDAYYRHIGSNPWLPKNTSMSDPVKQVNTTTTPVAIIGKFNFKTLGDLRPGDFVKVPIPNNAELITHTYEIIDGNYGLIGHIIANKDDSYYTFVFNKKIDNLTNIIGNFQVGINLKTPNDNNTFTLPQGDLQSYTYNNGTTSYDIQKLDTKNEDSNDNGCGRYYTLSKVPTTSLENFLQWEANFNNPLKNNLINDYGNSKVVLKILGNVGLEGVSDIQSYMPHLTDSFKLYEIENGNEPTPITLFTNETDFNNYTGTAQAGLLTFEKNNFIANIKFAKPVGNKGYKVEYKSATPADGSYVGNYLQIEVDGSFINLYDTQCSDKSEGFGSLTTAPFPLNSGSSSDWANRVRITKYLNGDVSEKGDGVVFTLNKLANGSDTEIDSSFATLTLTTDSEGKANTPKLATGRYILKETKTKPGGYTPVTNIFEIKEGNTNVIIKNFNNSINKRGLTGLLRKYWIDVENEAEYPAISLIAKVTYANLPDGTPISNPTVRYIPIEVPAGKLEANKNYVEITPWFPDHDDYGNHFYQDESKNILLQNQVTFELSEPNPPAGYTAIPNYGNNPNYIGNIKGDYNNKVRVYKYINQNKNQAGKGAVFTIEKLNTDGNVDTSFTKITLTTGADGFATSEALSPGNYIIKETKSVSGGFIDETYKNGVKFTINNGGLQYFEVNNRQPWINYRGDFRKYWPDLPAESEYPEISLIAKITYARKSDGTPISNPTVRELRINVPAGKLEADKNYAKIENFAVIQYDDYMNPVTTLGQLDIEFSEPNPPAGYTPVSRYLNNLEYIANLKGDYNNKVRVYKYLKGDRSLAGEGAIFTIEKLNADGNMDTSFTKITLTTGADGLATSEALPLGDYIIKETKPVLGGYIIDETYKNGVKFTINNDGIKYFAVNNNYGNHNTIGKYKIWVDAKNIIEKPEVRINATLTYKPTNVDGNGNTYPQTVRQITAIIPKGTAAPVDNYGNETTTYNFNVPYYDDYGNRIDPEIITVEEDIEGFESGSWFPNIHDGRNYSYGEHHFVNTLKNGKPITIKFQDIKGSTLQNDVKLLDRSGLKYFDAYSYDIPENIGSFKYKTADISNSKGSISEDTPMTIKGYATDTDQVIILIYEKKASASRINPHLRIRATNSK